MKSMMLPLAELKPALTGLAKVLQKRAALPVLQMLKIERTDEGWIALTATDLDVFATVRMEQPAEGDPLSLLVPFDALQTAAKSCGKGDSIRIESLPEQQVGIHVPVGETWAETRCDSLAVAEFPAAPKFKGEIGALPEPVRLAMQEALTCASESELRKILNGVFLDVTDNQCHSVVGTDGHHLYASNSFRLPMAKSVVVPTHRFLDWKGFHEDGEWRIKAGASEANKDQAWVQLSSRRWRFIAKQCEGNFPNWRHVLPKPDEHKAVIEIPEDALASTIQVMQRMPDHDEHFHTIGFSTEHGSLMLLGKSKKEDPDWINVPIPSAKVEGAAMKVFLNREYLIKALQFGLSRIELVSPLDAVKCVKAGRQMILMPIRTKGVAAQQPSPATPPNKPAVASTSSSAAKVEKETTSPAANVETFATTQESSKTTATASTSTSPTTHPMDRLLDDVLSDLETLKEDLSERLSTVKSIGAKVKLLQREHKANTREMQSVKQTIKTLQGVKL